MPKPHPLPVALERLSAREQIYVLGSYEIRPVKIGRSIDPEGRAAQLQTGFPFRLRVLWCTDGDTVLETALKREFKANQTCGEWFDFGSRDPVTEISTAVSRLSSTLAEERQRRAEERQRRAVVRQAEYARLVGRLAEGQTREP